MLRKAGYQSVYELGWDGNLPGFFVNLLLVTRALLRPVAFGVVGAVFDSEGRVLLVRQTYARDWRLPGGALGLGEAPEAALRRELHEEVGLIGGRVRLFGLYARKLWWLTHVVALYVIEDGEIHFRPNPEVSAIRWEAPNMPSAGIAPSAARRLAELAAGAQQDGRW